MSGRAPHRDESRRKTRASAFRPAVRGSVTTPLRGEVSGLGKGKKSADPRDFFSQATRSARSVYRGADRGLSLLPRLRISHPPPRAASRGTHMTQPHSRSGSGSAECAGHPQISGTDSRALPRPGRERSAKRQSLIHTHTLHNGAFRRARVAPAAARAAHTQRVGLGAATTGYVSENPLRKQGSRSLAWILMR